LIAPWRTFARTPDYLAHSTVKGDVLPMPAAFATQEVLDVAIGVRHACGKQGRADRAFAGADQGIIACVKTGRNLAERIY
jgi:hypothetical protein